MSPTYKYSLFTVYILSVVTLFSGNVNGTTATLSGTVTGGSLTDGTLTSTGGTITGAASITSTKFVGDVYKDDGTTKILENSTGALTGTVSSLSNHDTDDLSEGTAKFFTDARARSAISVGGDLTYNSSTGVITFTGVTASETRAHLSAGTGVTYTAGGQFSIGQSVGTGDDVTFNSVTGNVTGNLTGDSAGTHTGNVSGTTGTFSGAVSFGSLSDGTDTVTGFVTEADAISSNDNDATIPTSAAVRDYVDNFGGDGLMLRSALTSGVTTIDTAAMPNVSSRTYYASKIVIKIGTAFSGGSFNQILVKENGGSGTTLVAADDADAATAGTYIVELDGDISLTKNAAVQVQFKQADGSTDATTTAGVGTITVHYNYV